MVFSFTGRVVRRIQVSRTVLFRELIGLTQVTIDPIY